MALRPYPGFVGPSYTSQSKIACDDRVVNWIPAKIESGTGPADYVYDPAPGFSTFCDTGTAVGRGSFTLNGVTWAIFGANLFQLPIFAAGIPTLLAQGLNNPDNAPAYMVGNGDAGGQLMIMSGSTNYYLSLVDPPPAPAATFLAPPVAAAGLTNLGIGFVGSAMVSGCYGYAYSYVTAAGETLVSPVVAVFSGFTQGVSELAAVDVSSITIGLSGTVTNRKVYRTAIQTSLGAALTAQLKLLTTLADNTTTTYRDKLGDGSLGANAPIANTADISGSSHVALVGLNQNPYPATKIAFIDGYGLALDANRSELRWSALEDFSSWDALDVAQRNDSPDKWLAMIVAHKEIWLLGSKTGSVYYDSGGDPVFIPNPSADISRGIAAPDSLALLNGSPIWLADDLTVRYANGYTPQRISTHAVEFALSSYATVLDAEGYSYQEQGHQLYVLNLPTADATWVYDLTSGQWHERSGPWDGTVSTVMDVRTCVNAAEINLVLSRTGSAVYQMSQSFFVETDGVTGMRRVRRAPALVQSLKRIRYTHLRLMLEVGIGLSTGQGSDPQMMLRWSNDGGQSFGTEVLMMPCGALGAYGTMVEMWQMGQGRDRVFELSVSDPIPWRLVDAYLDFSLGSS